MSENEVSTVEIPTVDLGSTSEANHQLGNLESMDGVQSARVEGNRVILTVSSEAAQSVHSILYATGLRPRNTARCFQQPDPNNCRSQEPAGEEGKDTFATVLEAAERDGADGLIEALIQYGTLSPEARNAP